MILRIKHFILLISGLLLIISANAQQLQANWVQTLTVEPNQSQIAISESFLSPAEGNSLYEASLTSYASSYSTKPMGSWTIRQITHTGNILHSFTLGSIVSVIDIQSLGNEVLIAGSFVDSLYLNDSLILSNPTANGISPQEFIIRVDEEGKLVWAKDMYQELNYRQLQGLYLSPSEEVYYFFSEFSNYSAIVQLGEDGIDLDSLKIDDNGMIWDVKMDEAGNTYVSGSSGGTWDSLQIGTFSQPIPFNYSIFITKIDTSGNAVWVKFVEDITFSPVQLALDADGNLLAAGHLSSSQSWDSLHLEGPQWVYDYFLVKMNPQGNVLWAHEIQNDTGAITGDFLISPAQSIAIDSDGNIMLAGMLRGEVEFDTLTVQTGDLQTHGRAFILFNSEGHALASKVYTHDNTYFISGEVISIDDQWISSTFIRYGDSLEIDNQLIVTQGEATTLLIALSIHELYSPEVSQSPELFAYPNPAADYIILPGTSQDSSYQLFTLSGQCLAVLTSSQMETVISISHLKPGIYILKSNPSGNKIRFIKQ